jgi:transposase InsO family protein
MYRRHERFYALSALCDVHGISRQAYYQYWERQEHEVLCEDLVISLVVPIRRQMPMIGVRKLHYLLSEKLEQISGGIGRDKLFEILRKYELLIQRNRRYVRTTNSMHRFRIYKNLVKGLDVNRPDQVWVVDITYLRLAAGFCYLALLTDMFSRRIVGYDVSDSLELSGATRALYAALKFRKSHCNQEQTIHHSDRAIQYCSPRYTDVLFKNQLLVSMTEDNHVYENSLAERVNGILKSEFLLDREFKGVIQAHRGCREAIETYNRYRPHLSLNMLTPAQVYGR